MRINLINTTDAVTTQLTQPLHSESVPIPLLRDRFWQEYALDELNIREWEALCDGCGACCLEKFLDEGDTPEEVEYTDVACRLLDCTTGHCSDYSNRHQFVPACVSLTVDKLSDMLWLPNTCAYKRLYLGLELPDWHVLVTKDIEVTRQGMQAAGIGVAGRCVSETLVDEDDLEDRIILWVSAR